MNQTVYFTTRRCLTGVNEYRYFRGVESFGEASAQIMRNYPVSVRGAAITLHYEQDMDRTVFPGVHNVVTCAHSGKAIASVVWMGTGIHNLYTNEVQLEIRYRDGVYRFNRNGTEIAVMGKSPKKDASAVPKDDQWEPEYVLMTTGEVPDRLALLMLAFPLLQIAP